MGRRNGCDGIDISIITTLFCGDVSRTQMYLSDSIVTCVNVTNCWLMPRLVSCNATPSQHAHTTQSTTNQPQQRKPQHTNNNKLTNHTAPRIQLPNRLLIPPSPKHSPTQLPNPHILPHEFLPLPAPPRPYRTAHPTRASIQRSQHPHPHRQASETPSPIPHNARPDLRKKHDRAHR